jgi:hypothetical protein
LELVVAVGVHLFHALKVICKNALALLHLFE